MALGQEVVSVDSGMLLPTDSSERKRLPVGSGVLDYFPAALLAVAQASAMGNEQHGIGKALQWDRGRSAGHFDAAIRHLLERGGRDSDGQRHLAKAAWRVLAMLQLECEADWAPLARGAMG